MSRRAGGGGGTGGEAEEKDEPMGAERQRTNDVEVLKKIHMWALLIDS
jgi:hypothetical protein